MEIVKIIAFFVAMIIVYFIGIVTGMLLERCKKLGGNNG